jgi:hypothetical protein
MSASIKALTTGFAGFLLGAASTSFVHGQAETVTGTVSHIEIAVRDVDKSAKVFSELFGVTIPPALSMRDVPLGPSYHGRKMNVKYAPFTAFGMRLELIQDFDGGGVYSDFIAKHGEGIHHLGIAVADVPRTRDLLLARGAIRTVVVRADAAEIVDLAPMLPFSLDIGKAPAAR